MTKIEPTTMTCGLCGKTSPQMVMMSTNQFGSPDLDLRPPEMQRSTMWVWVQACPHCNYCAYDLTSQAPSEYLEYVKSKEYQEQFHNPKYPELARWFLCASMLMEYAGQGDSAGWSALHASWVCDDETKIDLAILCRKRALEQFMKARKRGGKFANNAGTEDALLADLFRRTNQDSELRTHVQLGLAKEPEPIIARILSFQLFLSSQDDRSDYRLDEVP